MTKKWSTLASIHLSATFVPYQNYFALTEINTVRNLRRARTPVKRSRCSPSVNFSRPQKQHIFIFTPEKISISPYKGKPKLSEFTLKKICSKAAHSNNRVNFVNRMSNIQNLNTFGELKSQFLHRMCYAKEGRKKIKNGGRMTQLLLCAWSGWREIGL